MPLGVVRPAPPAQYPLQPAEQRGQVPSNRGRPPVVQVRCHRAANSAVVLSVQDNGRGLSPDQQDKLYGLFRRLHDPVEGSGIGLYMVKRIVDNAGGTIAVQSAPAWAPPSPSPSPP
ncbi:ATP-binding protein [Hymenobacter sp. BT491]|uniref:ATP-binding protein n=1 Tax=Hymenobacter sp. BT491 TaxID=2766779 RepID=UPI001653A46D|nr:ATP-binding protein [Hymenobacter sp. BT491]MBC6992364.1 hypothetical protein [Hymenobacter sp. BT491]